MSTPWEKAAVLVEALPYIKKFYGKTIVIKYGGHAMLDDSLKEAVLTDAVLMKYVGMHPVIVHGGGPEITEMLKRVGKDSRFVGGLRVTDGETMEIVEMVLVGKINKGIVSRINRIGGLAVGLSGKDAGLFQAVKKYRKVRTPEGREETADIGFVGEISRVNPQIVSTVIAEGYIPVIAPVAVGPEGESYNINADYAAGRLAAALGADKLIILTDVEGIMADRSDPGSLISVLRASEVPSLIERGVIDGGMIPKVECCLDALAGGVRTTHILDGRVPHSILLEIFTDKGIGTMVEK
ncbi:acetylglutamate kinase [Pelotomaculum thermopropionicum SI]|uniref:Acetylglutamate kinase n=1 Tax=Pelotomaculum thermopropionicum (strain DSM 13744 / JCM 10971 / SI) TaxID=370438 RepID=ARGB_PELTS|nr:RecName: Full=Acetylglutamate kinase; AltName: Full=N-acetyl-L-glutamate 5-phosphotransferase; AltName: Full=NAG kinase; Short=NAGK [Pelotomaculum thermopropionicum SI]BAF58684.1 acetylglutamate kinase [Pelotomaculum thermopropionicum SI]